MKTLQLFDLMRLVAVDSDPHKVIEKTYDWEHTRRLEIGKWFLATGAAGYFALASLFTKSNSPSIVVLIIFSVSSTFAVAIGLGAFWRARYLSARYARIQVIIGELNKVKVFLQLLSREGFL